MHARQYGLKAMLVPEVLAASSMCALLEWKGRSRSCSCSGTLPCTPGGHGLRRQSQSDVHSNVRTLIRICCKLKYTAMHTRQLQLSPQRCTFTRAAVAGCAIALIPFDSTPACWRLTWGWRRWRPGRTGPHDPASWPHSGGCAMRSAAATAQHMRTQSDPSATRLRHVLILARGHSEVYKDHVVYTSHHGISKTSAHLAVKGLLEALQVLEDLLGSQLPQACTRHITSSVCCCPGPRSSAHGPQHMALPHS
jgi:hypothetical protein